MSKGRLTRIDKDRLPWVYRLILKIPAVDFLGSSSGGIFWGVIVPIFLVAEFWLSLLLQVLFPFPVNAVLVSIIPVAIFLMFIRISLERFINLWNLTVEGSGHERDIEKTMQEYLALIRKEKESPK